MGFSFVYASTLFGITATPVRVEADISHGLPKFTVVGLPDVAVSEARERVRSAIKNSNLAFPRSVITINLAPASVRKQGPMYDLAIAMSILGASNVIDSPLDLQKTLFLGELALDGSIRPVRGVLLAALMAKAHGYEALIVATENAAEAALVKNLRIHPARSLLEVVAHFNCVSKLPEQTETNLVEMATHGNDLRHIRGQEQAKRALEVAAAGGHNVLMYGPPGSGKTMLAKALPSLLPPLTFEHALEITAINSVAGNLSGNDPLVRERPFRAPHHTASGAALVGGGAWAKPGEISLAHRGVLFLDEFPEFSRQVLENLRQPLEDGVITVSRAAGTHEYPARFMLVAAMNPCPCGYLHDHVRACSCSPQLITKYQQKISGPLLDRIDIVIQMPRVELEKLSGLESGEASATVRERVSAARARQQTRYLETIISNNAELGAPLIEKYCQLNEECASFLKLSVARLHLSARAYMRVLKVARTIADLASSSAINVSHLAEALQYRPKLLPK